MNKRSDDIRTMKSHKVVFLGDASVGKTSIVMRFQCGSFDTHYMATVGIEFVPKVVQVTPTRSVKLQLWDTAGQEKFRSLMPSYLRGAESCVVVYDVSSSRSFKNVPVWVDHVRKECNFVPPVQLYVVGSKCDLSTERQVPQAEAEELAKRLDAQYFEVSAKANIGLTELFKCIASGIPENVSRAGTPPSRGVQLQEPRSAGSGRPVLKCNSC